MDGFMYIPFWRAGGYQKFTYRTQLYLAPLCQNPATLAVYLYENGGRPWSNKVFSVEIDQQVGEVRTDNSGMFQITMNPNQVLRVEINVLESEYGTGEVHLVSGDQQIALLARGELELFASKPSGEFEITVAEITMTGSQPTILQLGR
jgi:hypothetical protein